MQLEFDQLFGLPAHPLIVHVPVVLLPLAAIGAVAIAVSTRLRRSLGWIVVAIAGVGAFCTLLAVQSGEALEEAVEGTSSEQLVHEHAELGEQLRPIALLFLVVVFALVAWDWYQRRRAAEHPSSDSDDDSPRTRDPVMIAAALASIVLAVMVTISTYRAGHSGAEATWDRVQVEGNGE